MKMVLRVEAGNGHSIRSQRKGTECLMGTVLGQSTVCSWDCFVQSEFGYGTEIRPCVFLARYCLNGIACMVCEK